MVSQKIHSFCVHDIALAQAHCAINMQYIFHPTLKFVKFYLDKYLECILAAAITANGSIGFPSAKDKLGCNMCVEYACS